MKGRDHAVESPVDPTSPTSPAVRRRAHAILEVAVLFGALLVVPVLLMQQYGTSSAVLSLAAFLDWGIWLVFVAELGVVLSGRRIHHRGLLALDAAIVVLSFPLLPSGLESIRLARLVRITPALRVLRLLRLAAILSRAGTALRRMTRRRGLLQVGALTLLTAVGAAAGFVLIEPTRPTFEEGLWWAISTITTVGYGDYYPVSTTGRLLGALLMVCGVGLVAVFTAAMAAHFVEDDSDPVLAALERVEARLAALEERLGKPERGQGTEGSVPGGRDTPS
jgi:voltage-gated potassium channel